MEDLNLKKEAENEPDLERKGKERPAGMSLIVREVTRLLEPPIFIFGVYLTLTGHLSPGGGFPGGVVLASGFILVVLAYGRRAFRRLPPEGASKYDSLGVLLFLSLGLLGAILGGGFLYNFLRVYLPGTVFRLLSAGTIPLANIAIGMKVAASLFLVVMMLSLFRLGLAQEQEQEQGREPGGENGSGGGSGGGGEGGER